MRDGTPLLESIAIQGRVIRALTLREVVTRYGRHNIGFLWLFIEPCLYCAGLVTIWTHFREGGGKHGLSVAAFCLTGYSTVLLWRSVAGRCCAAITPNFSLMFHRNVRPIDILLSRIGLEIFSCAMQFYICTVVFIAIGLIKPPEDWILMSEGYLMMMWYATSLGILLGGSTEMSEVWERLWHPVSYFQLPICGLMFMVDWLPTWLQRLAVLVPAVNGVEMIRGGYFGRDVHVYYSVSYLAMWNICMTLIGLMFLKIFARKAVPE